MIAFAGIRTTPGSIGFRRCAIGSSRRSCRSGASSIRIDPCNCSLFGRPRHNTEAPLTQQLVVLRSQVVGTRRSRTWVNSVRTLSYASPARPPRRKTASGFSFVNTVPRLASSTGPHNLKDVWEVMPRLRRRPRADPFLLGHESVQTTIRLPRHPAKPHRIRERPPRTGGLNGINVPSARFRSERFT